MPECSLGCIAACCQQWLYTSVSSLDGSLTVIVSGVLFFYSASVAYLSTLSFTCFNCSVEIFKTFYCKTDFRLKEKVTHTAQRSSFRCLFVF